VRRKHRLQQSRHAQHHGERTGCALGDIAGDDRHDRIRQHGIQHNGIDVGSTERAGCGGNDAAEWRDDRFGRRGNWLLIDPFLRPRRSSQQFLTQAARRSG
jgi:hypothetical protein